jgi:predicted permease
MNLGGLVGALLPVFFVLALGYVAGKRNAFDADQSAGLSKLVMTFALPASLFVSMTEIRRDLLLQQGRLVVALIVAHAGLFVAAWLLLRLVPAFHGTPSIIYALMLATSATPVFGLAVLEPLLGPTSAGAVGLVALTINLTVPPAVVLLEIDAAGKAKETGRNPYSLIPVVAGLNAGLKSPLLSVDEAREAEETTNAHLPGSVMVGLNVGVKSAAVKNLQAAEIHEATRTSAPKPSPVVIGLSAGLKSPLLWGPILGIAVTFAGLHLPAAIAACFELIGSATSGVAVFAVGLVLASHAVRLSPIVLGGSLARVSVQSAVLFALLHLLHVVSPFAREALVCCSFPLATVVVLFAAHYRAVESEAASMLLVSTLALAVTVPTILWLSR